MLYFSKEGSDPNEETEDSDVTTFSKCSSIVCQLLLDLDFKLKYWVFFPSPQLHV